MSTPHAYGFWAYLLRDLSLANHRRGEVASPLVFLLMATTFIPLGIGPQSELLSSIAPGIIWVLALLTTLLSVEGLFSRDYHDGSLEQMLISPQILVMPVLGKVTAHWVVTGLPLTLFSPFLGLLLSLPSDGYLPLAVGLALGTGCLSLLAAVGAALTVTLQQSGLLLTLIVMPLYMPVIIFGSSVAQYGVDGLNWMEPLAALGAMLALTLAFCPLAVAGILRLTTIN